MMLLFFLYYYDDILLISQTINWMCSCVNIILSVINIFLNLNILILWSILPFIIKIQQSTTLIFFEIILFLHLSIRFVLFSSFNKYLYVFSLFYCMTANDLIFNQRMCNDEEMYCLIMKRRSLKLIGVLGYQNIPFMNKRQESSVQNKMLTNIFVTMPSLN